MIQINLTFEVAYDLMQHETLSVNFDANPLDVTVYLGLLDIDRQHMTLDSLGVVSLEKGIIVEVAAKSHARPGSTPFGPPGSPICLLTVFPGTSERFLGNARAPLTRTSTLASSP